jgi:Streptomyces sporulation and cell division protein, SsgA
VIRVRTDDVLSELQFALVIADNAPIRVGAQLRYDAHDPFAVCVSFDAGGPDRIEWTFARDLLEQGLRQEAGDGDVKIWPRRGAVFLSLCSPSGRAVLETPWPAVADFIARTQRVVPAGRESDFVDLDRELDSLFS